MVADNKVTGRLATGLQFQRLSRYDFVIFTGASKAPTKLKKLLLRYLWNIEKIFQGFSCDRLSGNQFLFNLTPDVKFISDLDQALIGTSFLLLNFLLVNAVLAKWKPQVMTNTRGLRNWLFEKLSSSRPRDQTPFVSRDNIGLLPYACVMWASLVFTSSSSLLNYNPYSHILGILLLIIFMVVESSSSLRLNYNRATLFNSNFNDDTTFAKILGRHLSKLQVVLPVILDVIIGVYDNSIELLGDLLFKVAGTFGRAILELCSDDEGPSTEAHGLVIIEVLGQRSRNEVLAEIYMGLWLCRLLEPLEKQFLRLGVMTKVQAQRHMDDPAIIEVPGQRSHNEVLAEIYMVRSDINWSLHQLCGISFYCVLFSCCHITILHNEFNVVVEHKRISYFLCLAALYVWKTIFFSRLLEPLEKQFLSLGVMTKVQAQRYIDDLAIIEVIGQRSCNEVLAEIYMVRSDINLTLHQLCGIFVNKEGLMALQVAGTFGKAILEGLWLCRLLEPLEKQFLRLGVMTKVQAQRHMDDPAIIQVLGQRSRNEVLAEIYMGLWLCRLLEPLEKQFLRLGVMTKVQAQRHMDDPAIIQLCGISFYCVLFSYCHITILHNEFNVVVEKFIWLLEPLEKQFLSLGVMTKVQAQRHMDDPAIIEVLGQRSRNEVLAEIYMGLWLCRLLEPLEKQFLRLGVMTKVQAQRHMDDPAIIQVLGQRSRNEVLAEIYMVRSDINLTLLQLCGISFYRVLFSCCHITILHNEFNVVVEHKRISYFLYLVALHVWKTIFFSRLLEPLEKKFLSLGVMTKVQAQRHMDGPAIIEVLGQRSRNEVLAEIYMVARTFGKAILELWSDDEGPSIEAHG
ncbi:hypothetical protein ZIOFF_022059 [Zingiber officinale]|uniref:Uncharacterized protein n=1 Tax=Zingiber officinale TaxID=94328 RepID=A0A8J5H7X2_ZINOF|nr:hypothetical protein ZIOFF_022059 [Zingiber officinale]